MRAIDPKVKELSIRSLESDQPNDQISGLQLICREIESGCLPVSSGRLANLTALLCLSPIAKIRRWAYYAVRLLRLEGAVSILEFSLLREIDPSCRLWAWTSFTQLAPPAAVQDLIANTAFNYLGTPLQLIPLPPGVSLPQGAPTILWDDVREDPGAARWVPISFGYAEAQLGLVGLMPMDRALIRDLQMHEDVSVAEYAVWSFFNRRDGRSSDLVFGASEIATKSSGIRGWAYRLLFKDGPTAEGVEFAAHAIVEELKLADRAARLGLARALRTYYWFGMENFILSWAEAEKDDHIILALVDHMIMNAGRCNEYVGFVSGYYRSVEPRSEARISVEVSLRRAGLLPGSRVYDEIDRIRKKDQTRGDVVMGNKVEIGSIGAINANVVNFGTMRDAAKDSLYQVDHRHVIAPIQKDIDRFIDLVDVSPDIPDDLKLEAVTAIKEIAQAEPGKVQGLATKAIESVQKVATAAKSSVEIVEAAQKIAEVLQSVF